MYVVLKFRLNTMALIDKPLGGNVHNSSGPSTFESDQKTRAMKPTTRWRLRWESETGVIGPQKIEEKTSIGQSSGENADSGTIPATFEAAEAVKKIYKGINFYKRIGLWTANIWDSTVETPKQIYLGSYSTLTEAASAYDKASLKLYGESINHDISEYYKDIEKMGRVDKTAYIDMIRSEAEISKTNHASTRITACPRGWYEVKIRETSRPKNWRYLGRYRDPKEAERVLAAELQESLDSQK